MPGSGISPMSALKKDTIIDGNGPKVTYERLLELRSKFCAVEFGTRELLGFGDTWDEAKTAVYTNGFEGRQFYKFRVPSDLVEQNAPTEQQVAG